MITSIRAAGKVAGDSCANRMVAAANQTAVPEVRKAIRIASSLNDRAMSRYRLRAISALARQATSV